MTLRQLEYFCTICKYNNITRAAQELHVAQSSLSHMVRELEQEFAVNLFSRRSRGLCLTKEGEVLREEATRVLEQAERLSERMEQFAETNTTIRLGVPPMLASLVFPRLLQEFHRIYPHIRLEIAENGTLTNERLVKEGELDAALVSGERLRPSALAFCNLDALRICFYISASRCPSGRTFTELVQNCPLPLVCLTEDSFLTDYMKRQFARYKLAPEILLHTNQLNTIRQLVENGTAAAFLYDHVIEETSSITKVLPDELPLIHARLVWDPARQPSRAFGCLLRLVKSQKRMPLSVD